MKVIMDFLDRLDKFFAIIAAITLTVMMFWIFADVMLRTFFNNPIKGTLEITGEYLMVILVYFALSYTQKFDGHVRVSLFVENFPTIIRKISYALTNVVAAFFFVYVGYLNFNVGIEYAERGMKSIGVLGYPLAPALFIIAFGLFMIALRLVFETIRLFTSKELPVNPEGGQHDAV